MKYLKTNSTLIFQTDNLTKEDLGRLKSGQYDCIIDVEKELYFDGEDNEWKPIQKV